MKSNRTACRVAATVLVAGAGLVATAAAAAASGPARDVGSPDGESGRHTMSLECAGTSYLVTSPFGGANLGALQVVGSHTAIQTVDLVIEAYDTTAGVALNTSPVFFHGNDGAHRSDTVMCTSTRTQSLGDLPPAVSDGISGTSPTDSVLLTYDATVLFVDEAAAPTATPTSSATPATCIAQLASSIGGEMAATVVYWQQDFLGIGQPPGRYAEFIARTSTDCPG